jgi:hypothetical protein
MAEMSKSRLAVPAEPAAPPDERQVWETVAFFEQMLQTMPEDRVSLEVLADAYGHAGDSAKARDFLLRLAQIVIRDNDRAAARALHGRLAEYAGEPGVAEILARLASLMVVTATASQPRRETAPAVAPPVVAPPPQKALDAAQLVNDQGYRRQIINQELELAWLLHERQFLNEDQYTMLVNDLAELSSKAEEPKPLSILYLFQDRQLPGLDKALAMLAEKSGLPLLPLHAFEPQREAGQALPFDYQMVRGALPFDAISRDLLVAVLNPLSEDLRRDVARVTKRACHFFLVSPGDFERAAVKIKNLPAPSAGA